MSPVSALKTISKSVTGKFSRTFGKTSLFKSPKAALSQELAKKIPKTQSYDLNGKKLPFQSYHLPFLNNRIVRTRIDQTLSPQRRQNIDMAISKTIKDAKKWGLNVGKTRIVADDETLKKMANVPGVVGYQIEGTNNIFIGLSNPTNGKPRTLPEIKHTTFHELLHSVHFEKNQNFRSFESIEARDKVYKTFNQEIARRLGPCAGEHPDEFIAEFPVLLNEGYKFDEPTFFEYKRLGGPKLEGFDKIERAPEGYNQVTPNGDKIRFNDRHNPNNPNSVYKTVIYNNRIEYHHDENSSRKTVTDHNGRIITRSEGSKGSHQQPPQDGKVTINDYYDSNDPNSVYKTVIYNNRTEYHHDENSSRKTVTDINGTIITGSKGSKGSHQHQKAVYKSNRGNSNIRQQSPQPFPKGVTVIVNNHYNQNDPESVYQTVTHSNGAIERYYGLKSAFEKTVIHHNGTEEYCYRYNPENPICKIVKYKDGSLEHFYW